jgi:PhnB protein
MSETAAGGVPVIRDVYPYLCVRDAAAAIEFYTGVFGAEELLRLTSLDGRIAHAELSLGPSWSCWPTSIPSTAYAVPWHLVAAEPPSTCM